jgi:hypothetical protein
LRLCASFFVAAFALFVIATLTGCGPGRGDLSGKVYFEEKIVSSGSVIVGGSDGVPRSGEIAADGSYAVKDIAAGQVKITVHSPDPGAVKYIPRKDEDKPPPPKDRSKWFPLPDEYNDFTKSGLTFKLRRGVNNSFDIKLTAK